MLYLFCHQYFCDSRKQASHCFPPLHFWWDTLPVSGSCFLRLFQSESHTVCIIYHVMFVFFLLSLSFALPRTYTLCQRKYAMQLETAAVCERKQITTRVFEVLLRLITAISAPFGGFRNSFRNRSVAPQRQNKKAETSGHGSMSREALGLCSAEPQGVRVHPVGLYWIS